MILDRFRVTDKVAIVTGAGRGIGAGTAIALAEAGADVVLSARTETQLTEVAQRITDAGRTAHVVPADLSDPDTASTLAEQATQRFGRLDIVVNNVGGTVPRPLLETSTEYLEQAFRFNVAVAHALTSAATRPMLADGGGSVLNISSVMGRVSGRGYLAYGTAKAALTHYTRLAAADLAPTITVNAIGVGSVLTSALDVVANNDELRGQMEANTPLRRLGNVEDVAATAVYLASPAGGYLTGKLIEVDGGLQTPNLELGLPDLT